jgi:SAM-dependent methyltransferase
MMKMMKMITKMIIKGEIKIKKVSLDSYEIMAEDYGSFIDFNTWNTDYERPCTTNMLGNVLNKVVLDAGCAAGWYTKKFLNDGADKVVALDFSPKMIEETKNRLKDIENKNYDVIQWDLNEKLSFLSNETFDTILSSLTMHYLEDWETPLNEFNRVLKPKGELIISIHHPFADYLQFKNEDYFMRNLVSDIWHMNGKEVKVQFYTRSLSEMTNALTKAGFFIEKMEEPMPTIDFKRKDEKNYEWLTKNPNFLFIKCIKK